MSHQSPDVQFANRLGAIILNGAVTGGLVMGSKLGLFEKLYGLANCQDKAVTSDQLADAMNFKRRYVLEWIRGMACCDVVDHVYIDGEHRFWIADHRKFALLGDQVACPLDIAGIVGGLMEAQNKVIECFPKDGPSGTHVDDHMGLHAALGRGRRFWKAHENMRSIYLADLPELAAKLDSGIKVLEVGCGFAHPSRAFAKCFPNSQFVVSDMSSAVLEGARKNCEGIPNIEYRVINACKLDTENLGHFDLVMIYDVLHDVPEPKKLLDGIYQLIKPGGDFILNDVGTDSDFNVNKTIDEAAYYYMASVHYCVPTSLNDPNSAALGACAGVQLYEKMMTAAGFKDIKRFCKDVGCYFHSTK